MTYKATGFIISKRFSRERDRIFVIYTKEYGKIEALAQGVLKLESKLAGNLELLSKASFLIARGRVFDRVAGIDIEERFLAITQNFQKLVVALYSAEILYSTVHEKAPDASLFTLLEDFFSELDALGAKTETRTALYLAHLFIIKLSLILGYRSNSRVAAQFLDALAQKRLSAFLSNPAPHFAPMLAQEFLNEQLHKKLNTQSYIDFLVKETLKV
ncbi:DNA repair protein RecO [Candidatus Uhrbacteria bacterium]|nr:DNA repair protein RecO [Candidatus Uhrbacteria bacterium]